MASAVAAAGDADVMILSMMCRW